MKYKYDIARKKVSMNFQKQVLSYQPIQSVPHINMPYFTINLNSENSNIPPHIISYDIIHPSIPTILLNEPESKREDFIKTNYPVFYENYLLEEFKEKIWKFCMLYTHGGIFTEGLTLPFFSFLKRSEMVIQKNSTTFACVKESKIIYDILENIHEPVEEIIKSHIQNIYWLYANPIQVD